MPFFERLARCWRRRRPRPIEELLEVEYDDREVRVRVQDRLDPGLNRSFRWEEVVRVCFKDEGMFASDLILIQLAGEEPPVVVPSEARGGDAFFGALCGRGLLPEDVWRRAIGETGGRMHCWPPFEEK